MHFAGGGLWKLHFVEKNGFLAHFDKFFIL
jgi:hypothetical protein